MTIKFNTKQTDLSNGKEMSTKTNTNEMLCFANSIKKTK